MLRSQSSSRAWARLESCIGRCYHRLRTDLRPRAAPNNRRETLTMHRHVLYLVAVLLAALCAPPALAGDGWHTHLDEAVAAARANAKEGGPGLILVDLYAEYPDFRINVDREQQRLLSHDVIVFHHPLYWYSTPAILKEWQDLVLEHGFDYGSGGDSLRDKRMLLAITAAGPEDAYSPGGYQHYPIRDFLRPLEQTARLCDMRFSTPYVLFGSLKSVTDGRVDRHVEGYRQLLLAIRDGRYDWDVAERSEVLDFDSLPIIQGN